MGGLVLGPVVFSAFEVPKQIAFGGRQRLAVHALPGGGRVVDAMGGDDGPIGWEGVCSGPSAPDRVRLLEALRRDGGVLQLSWGGWRHSVVLEQFRAVVRNPAWIPYSVRLCIVDSGYGVDDGDLPAPWSAEEAASFGAGPDLEERIAEASAGVSSGDVATAIAASGALARLVLARSWDGG